MELGVASLDSVTRVELDNTKSFEIVKKNLFFFSRKNGVVHQIPQRKICTSSFDFKMAG